MGWIRAKYNNGTVTRNDDNSQLATDQTKYWTSMDGVDDNLGMWDNTNNKFIPDGWFDETTTWLLPLGYPCLDDNLTEWENR